MKIIRVEEVERKRRSDGRIVQKLCIYPFKKAAKDSILLIVDIPKGCAEKEHYHTESVEIFYFLKNAKVEVNNETYRLAPGDILFLDPHDKHRVVADENSVKLLVIKLPSLNDKIVCDEGN